MAAILDRSRQPIDAVLFDSDKVGRTTKSSIPDRWPHLDPWPTLELVHNNTPSVSILRSDHHRLQKEGHVEGGLLEPNQKIDESMRMDLYFVWILN
jgi:hypothetical protein